MVPSLSQHPLPRLLDDGVRCTLSTDDPFCFGNTLTDEYLAVATDMGLDRAALVALAHNGFEVAVMDDEMRAVRLAELDVIAESSSAS